MHPDRPGLRRTVIERQWRLWSSLRETAYLLASPVNAEMLLGAVAELEASKLGKATLIHAEFDQNGMLRMRT